MLATTESIAPYSTDSVVRKNDPKAIRTVAAATNVFNRQEIEIAGELAEEVLDGSDSSYQFIFYRKNDMELIAYSCFCEIPLTEKRYDLYWIVVTPIYHGKGVAQRLLAETEETIRKENGKILYAETSGTDLYIPTRRFYLKEGFKEAARFPDFYRDGDDKVVFSKIL